MLVLVYVIAIVMGGTLGLIGGGGSILTVPTLVYLLRLPAEQATAYSLFIVGLSSMIAAFDYYKRDLLDFKTAIFFSIPAFTSVYLTRRFLIPALPENINFLGLFDITKDNLILVAFAIVMLLASISMIRKNSQAHPTANVSPRILLLGVQGIVVGVVTGFVGAGGGFIITPALVLLAGLDMKRAVGTSLFIIAINSLIGFVGDLQTDMSIDWRFLAVFSGFSLVGIFIGTLISRKVDGRSLKPAFGWFVLVMGSFMLIKEVFLS